MARRGKKWSKRIPLTQMHSDETVHALATTKPGQASWAGKGPEGTKCYQCAFYEIERKPGSIVPVFAAHIGYCMKREELQPNEKRARFDPRTDTCRYFESLLEKRRQAKEKRLQDENKKGKQAT